MCRLKSSTTVDLAMGGSCPYKASQKIFWTPFSLVWPARRALSLCFGSRKPLLLSLDAGDCLRSQAKGHPHFG